VSLHNLFDNFWRHSPVVGARVFLMSQETIRVRHAYLDSKYYDNLVLVLRCLIWHGHCVPSNLEKQKDFSSLPIDQFVPNQLSMIARELCPLV
jgi:hypothetical protein